MNLKFISIVDVVRKREDRKREEKMEGEGWEEATLGERNKGKWNPGVAPFLEYRNIQVCKP